MDCLLVELLVDVFHAGKPKTTKFSYFSFLIFFKIKVVCSVVTLVSIESRPKTPWILKVKVALDSLDR